MKEKIRRITALVGIIVLVGLYIAAIAAAVSGSENWSQLLGAALVLTVIVPIILYVLGIFLRGGREDTLTRALRNHEPDSGFDMNSTNFPEDEKKDE